MEMLLVKDFMTHEFYNKVSVHLLLGFLTNLLFSIQLIQFTATNKVCAVMPGHSTRVFFKLVGFLRVYFSFWSRKKVKEPYLT